MAWHTVVIAALALAVACDLYLHGRALLKERGRARAGMLAWSENRRTFYELAGREFERARRYDPSSYSPAILIPSMMNCTAMAQSTSPMSRVRIRIPVWPSFSSTRGAAASVT